MVDRINEKILQNRAMCLDCDSIITSVHRHDYVTCCCGNLAVDGGLDYLKRMAANLTKYLDMSIVKDMNTGEITDNEEMCKEHYSADQLYDLGYGRGKE